MSPHAAVTDFLFSHDYSPAGLEWYENLLGAFVAFCDQAGVQDLSDLTGPHLRRFLDVVRERVNPRTNQPVTSLTVHGYARAIRAFLRWAAREDLIDDRVVRKLVMPRRETRVIQTFTERQVELLFRAATVTPTPYRDQALLATLLDTGIRASELCGLTLDRVHLSQNDAWLLVYGKGSKWREVGMGHRSRQLLHRYIHRERKAPLREQHVFLGHRGKMTPSGVTQTLYTLRDKAGLQHFTSVRVSAHTARHYFALKWVEQGGDVASLSRVLGHTSLATTENYLRTFGSHQARQRGVSPLDSIRR